MLFRSLSCLINRNVFSGKLGLWRASNLVSVSRVGYPRLLSDAVKKTDENKEDSVKKEDADKPEDHTRLGRAPAYQHKPTNFDKRMLVWSKKYASIEEVPDFVSKETMDKAKSKIRIYTNLIMAALTFGGCIAMIISGKRAVKRGESLSQQNLDWHKSHKEPEK